MWTGWRNALQRWKANHDANLERLGKRRALGWATYHHRSNLERLGSVTHWAWATEGEDNRWFSLPPKAAPASRIHRRPHISPVCGLVRIRTRRLLHANHESRTGTKPERLATQTHQRAFMENACHGTAGQSSRWIRNPADKGCTLPRCGVPTFP